MNIEGSQRTTGNPTRETVLETHTHTPPLGAVCGVYRKSARAKVREDSVNQGRYNVAAAAQRQRESERWDEANRYFQENLRLSNSLDEQNKEEGQQKKSPGLESQGQENGSINVI